MNTLHQKIFESEIDVLLNSIVPQPLPNKRRSEVFEFLKRILINVIDCRVVLSGSFPLRTYLPESDLDVIILPTNAIDAVETTDTILSVFKALCDNVIKDHSRRIYPEMTIRNIEFVNARTKLAHCVINNMNVDITVNQIGALSSSCFLEEADRLIGNNHLFKRSLILIKSWCLNESIRYNSVGSIAGSKCGMLSSYALSILVLYVFNLHARSNNLHHPLNVFRFFLLTYSSFPWDRCALSLDGLIPIQNGCFLNTTPTVINLFQVITNKMKNTTTTYQDNISSSSNTTTTTTTTTANHNTSPMLHKLIGNVHNRFQIRACNIIDPIDTSNNLGISVTPTNLAVIDFTFKSAAKDIEGVLQWHQLHTSDAIVSHHIIQNLQLHHNSKNGSFNVQSMTIPIAPGCDSNYLSTATKTSFTGISSFDPTSRTQPQQHTSQLGQYASPNLFLPVMVDSHQQVFHTLTSNFLRNFFPCSVDRYLKEGSVRADLLDHPLQQGIFINRAAAAAFSPLPPPAQAHGETHRSNNCRRSFDETESDPLLGDLIEMREACFTDTTTTFPYTNTTNEMERCHSRSLWSNSNTTSPDLSSTGNSSTLLVQGLYSIDSESHHITTSSSTDCREILLSSQASPLPPSATVARYRSKSEGMVSPSKEDSNTNIANWNPHINRSLRMNIQESTLYGIAEGECYHHLNKRSSDATSTLLDNLHRASCEPTPSIDGSLTDSENSQQEDCHNNKYCLHSLQDSGDNTNTNTNIISRDTSAITSFSTFQHTNSLHAHDEPSSTSSSSLRLTFPDIITSSISTEADIDDGEVEVEVDVQSIPSLHNLNLPPLPQEVKSYDNNNTHEITMVKNDNYNNNIQEESSNNNSNDTLCIVDNIHENMTSNTTTTCHSSNSIIATDDNPQLSQQLEGTISHNTNSITTITPPSPVPPLALTLVPTEIESVSLSLLLSSQNSNCNKNFITKSNNKSKKSIKNASYKASQFMESTNNNSNTTNKEIKAKNKNNVKYCNTKINQNSNNNNNIISTPNNNNNNNKMNVNNNPNNNSHHHLASEISNIKISENIWSVRYNIGLQIVRGFIEEWKSYGSSSSRRFSGIRVSRVLSLMLLILFLYCCCQGKLLSLSSGYLLNLGKLSQYDGHRHSYLSSTNIPITTPTRTPTSFPTPAIVHHVVYWVREGASFSIETQVEEGEHVNNDLIVSKSLSSISTPTTTPTSYQCSEESSSPGCESSSASSRRKSEVFNSVITSSTQSPHAYYQWTKDHEILINQTKRLLTLRDMTTADEGIYRCYLTISTTKPTTTTTTTNLSKLNSDNKSKLKAENQEDSDLMIGLGKLVMNIHIRLSAPPKCRTKPSHHMLTTGSDLLLHVRAEGIPPPSYQWMRNGYPLPNETNASLVTHDVSKAHEGTYSCLIENVAGSMVWLEATVVVRLSR